MAVTRTRLGSLLWAACFLFAPSSPAQELSLRSLSTSIETLVRQVSPAVVQVMTQGIGQGPDGDPSQIRTQRGTGSGVIVDPEGYIVTNSHVVRNATRIKVLITERPEQIIEYQSVVKPPGRIVDARVVGQDRETDIAVLKVDVTGLPSLHFISDSEALKQGELVFAAGSPYGLQNSVSMGVVSSVARQVRPDDPMIYIQTDAPINPGNSGGPLLNSGGEVVGINTFIVSQSGGSQGVGFAAPANIVRSVYEQIRKSGRVRRGQVGVVIQTLTPDLARALQLPRTSGAIIADVAPGGPAQAAGLEVKDIVLTLNGKPIENARQFGVNIYRRAGEEVTLEILRGGEKQTRTVAVLERPKDPDRILSLIQGEENTVRPLGILAVNLDEKVTPFLPNLRKLSGVVVAGTLGGEDSQNPLEPGDVIYEVNNQAIRGLKDLHATVGSRKPGQPLAVQVERQGQLQFVVMEAE
jgi:serine protease Do